MPYARDMKAAAAEGKQPARSKGVSPRVAWTLTALGALAGGLLSWLFRSTGDARDTKSGPPALLSRARTQVEVAEVVFDSGFKTGWQDWGWGPRQTPDAGPLKVGFAGYGGIIFHHAELSAPFGGLTFRFRAPKQTGNFLSASLKYKRADPTVLPIVPIDQSHVAELDEGWKEVLIPWSALNPKLSPFDRIVIQARELTSSDCVIIVTDHSSVDYTRVARLAPLVVDTRGVLRNATSGGGRVVGLSQSQQTRAGQASQPKPAGLASV